MDSELPCRADIPSLSAERRGLFAVNMNAGVSVFDHQHFRREVQHLRDLTGDFLGLHQYHTGAGARVWSECRSVCKPPVAAVGAIVFAPLLAPRGLVAYCIQTTKTRGR